MAADIGSRLEKFRTNQAQLADDSKRLLLTINQDFSQLDAQIGKVKAQQRELKELQALLQQPQQQQVRAVLRDELHEAAGQLQRLQKSLTPRTGSVFVRLFLGRVNVKHYRDGDRWKLKQEYQKFKSKTDVLFVVFALVQLALLHWAVPFRPLEILFQAWLLYYYCTLCLRENILKVNGSSIRQWWIIHHYLSIGLSLTILSWSPDPRCNYYHFLPQFLVFSLCQGLVQVLQSIYQTRRLYRLVAMGHATRMDVAVESAANWGSGPTDGCTTGLILLAPFIFFIQFFQLYNGFCLLRLFWESISSSSSSKEAAEWQVFVAGLLFLLLGAGNLATTVQTFWEKGRGREKKREKKTS